MNERPGIAAYLDLLTGMTTHDGCHAGEIKHLRSLLGTDDRWRYVQLGFR